MNTLEHRRFAEFCDACGRYRYIGLCYGPSGVGKTLSAKRYSRWDQFREGVPCHAEYSEGPALDTVFYTPSVVNSPGRIGAGREIPLCKLPCSCARLSRISKWKIRFRVLLRSLFLFGTAHRGHWPHQGDKMVFTGHV